MKQSETERLVVPARERRAVGSERQLASHQAADQAGRGGCSLVIALGGLLLFVARCSHSSSPLLLSVVLVSIANTR